MAHVSSTAEYWDEHADNFDAKPDHGLHDPAIHSAWATLLTHVTTPPPARIADVGCGTGTLSVLLGEAGYRVSGIDFAPRMVANATAKAAAAGVVADFVVADATAPPWPAKAFDVVLARPVLWGLPDAGRALDGWLNLLTPQGRLVIVDGCWGTAVGLAAGEALALLRARGQDVSITMLDDPALWGGPVSDERYLLVSH